MSHHPPISAFYVSNRKDGFCISGSILAKSKFYGEFPLVSVGTLFWEVVFFSELLVRWCIDNVFSKEFLCHFKCHFYLDNDFYSVLGVFCPFKNC